MVLDGHDDDGRVGCARRPCTRARPRLSARRARLSYGDFYAKSSAARWIAASQMWFASVMSADILSDGDDKKLIKKFICDKGLINVMNEPTKKDIVCKLCGKEDSKECQKQEEAEATPSAMANAVKSAMWKPAARAAADKK